MTLRIKIEIVPYGDEAKVYEIGRLNIHNLGYAAEGHCVYRVDGHGMINHKRDDGAWRLVQKAIAELEITGP